MLSSFFISFNSIILAVLRNIALDYEDGLSYRSNCGCISRGATSARCQYSKVDAVCTMCGKQSHRSGRSGNATCDTTIRFDATGRGVA